MTRECETVLCRVPSCRKPFERPLKKSGRRQRIYCSTKCNYRARQELRCYCLTFFDDSGKCPYDCPPEANPKHLAEIDRRIAAQEHHKRLAERPFITAEDHKRVCAAVARFDPFLRRHQPRARRAANRRYRVGAVK